jgi:hypothetical protein
MSQSMKHLIYIVKLVAQVVRVVRAMITIAKNKLRLRIVSIN